MKDKIPHTHSEVIKAWADGEIIQFRTVPSEEWTTVDEPMWSHVYEYRVKPKDVVLYANVPLVKFLSYENLKDGFGIEVSNSCLFKSNLKIYFDEKGKLSKAEVIS